MVQKRNLSREKITAAAVALVDEKGADALSFSQVAAMLEVKSQALYAYFESKQALKVAVIVNFLDAVTREISSTLIGISGEEALLVYGRKLRELLLAQPELCRLAFGGINYAHQGAAIDHLHALVTVLETLIEPYATDADTVRNKARLFRATVFGFVQNELWGLFQRGTLTAAESFDYAIHQLIQQITQLSE